MYRVGCCPLLDWELILRGDVAEIGSVGLDVGVRGISGDEDYLSFRCFNYVLVSARNSDGAEDRLGSKFTLMRSDRSSFRDSVVRQSS